MNPGLILLLTCATVFLAQPGMSIYLAARGGYGLVSGAVLCTRFAPDRQSA